MKHATNSDNHFFVSQELLLLLEWLIVNRPAELKKLVATAYDNGLREDIAMHASSSPEENQAYLQQNVIDFFIILEDHLQEAASELGDRWDAYKNQCFSSAQIDALLKNQKPSEQKLFYKRLLKNLRVSKNSIQH